MTKYASVCPHFGHRMRVFGRVASSSETTEVSFSMESVVKTCALPSWDWENPHSALMQTYFPPFGNIIEPHWGQNKLISLLLLMRASHGPIKGFLENAEGTGRPSRRLDVAADLVDKGVEGALLRLRPSSALGDRVGGYRPVFSVVVRRHPGTSRIRLEVMAPDPPGPFSRSEERR